MGVTIFKLSVASDSELNTELSLPSISNVYEDGGAHPVGLMVKEQA